jgi:ABC-2 type transport system permease protein
MEVVVEKNTLFGRGIEYLDFLAPGVVMMTILFSAFFTGGLNLIMDRQVGTLRMLMVAPISKEAIILGKTLAGVMQSITSGGVALGVAMLMGVEIKSGLMGLFLVFFLMFVSGFGFIGISLIFGSRITYIEQFMVVMMVFIMPMWFLSGGLYPVESMPEWMRFLALINPMTYATEAMRAVMLRGIIWESFARDVIILLGFAISMMVAGSLSFKRTIE